MQCITAQSLNRRFRQCRWKMDTCRLHLADAGLHNFDHYWATVPGVRLCFIGCTVSVFQQETEMSRKFLWFGAVRPQWSEWDLSSLLSLQWTALQWLNRHPLLVKSCLLDQKGTHSQLKCDCVWHKGWLGVNVSILQSLICLQNATSPHCQLPV